eukprot:g24392.t1
MSKMFFIVFGSVKCVRLWSGLLRGVRLLLAEFPGVKVTSPSTGLESNGKFEVQIVGGPLLHSKKQGQGYCEGAKLTAMIQRAHAYLEESSLKRR